MILTRLVKRQLALFSVASVIGVVVLSLVFLRVPSYLGIGEYTLMARFTDAARLYERAEVTLRGAPVGLVEAVRLVEDGIEVEMSIDETARIPHDVRAEIHSRSAIGEQYVDLIPVRDRGPFLEEGDVIPTEHTTIPEQIGPVLDQVNALLATLPTDDLTTVIDESYAAFRGAGPDLQRLLDNGALLLDEADRAYEPTERLLDDLGPLLETQTATSPEIRSLTKDLAEVTEQLRVSDSDLRAVLHEGQPFAEQITELFRDAQPTLPVLLANLTTLGDVLVTYQPHVEQVLVVYPALVAAAQSLALPHEARDEVALDLAVGINDPPPCLAGFLPPEQWRDPADLSTVTPPPAAFCALPQDDPSAVRGARNIPCAENPGVRAPSPEACGREFRPAAEANPPFPPGSPGAVFPSGATPSVATAPYDPVTGRVFAPDGQFFLLGGVGGEATTPEDMTWQSLMLGPVGR